MVECGTEHSRKTSARQEFQAAYAAYPEANRIGAATRSFHFDADTAEDAGEALDGSALADHHASRR